MFSKLSEGCRHFKKKLIFALYALWLSTKIKNIFILHERREKKKRNWIILPDYSKPRPKHRQFFKWTINLRNKYIVRCGWKMTLKLWPFKAFIRFLFADKGEGTQKLASAVHDGGASFSSGKQIIQRTWLASQDQSSRELLSDQEVLSWKYKCTFSYILQASRKNIF